MLVRADEAGATLTVLGHDRPWGIYAGSPFTNVVGVCHSVRDTHAFLARTVGVPEEQVRFLTAGFNHQCFVYRFEDRRTGEDLYPRLRAIVKLLFGLSAEEIIHIEIPTGNPLLIDLDAALKPTAARYLDAARAQKLPG